MRLNRQLVTCVMLLSLNCPEVRSCGLVSLKLDVRRKYGFFWEELPIPASLPLRPADRLLSTISTQSAVRSCHFEFPPLACAEVAGPKARSTLGLSLFGATVGGWGSENGAAIQKWFCLLSSRMSNGMAEWTYPTGEGPEELAGEMDDSTRVSWTGLDETWYSCVASFNPFFFISFNCCCAKRYLHRWW